MVSLIEPCIDRLFIVCLDTYILVIYALIYDDEMHVCVWDMWKIFLAYVG